MNINDFVIGYRMILPKNEQVAMSEVDEFGMLTL